MLSQEIAGILTHALQIKIRNKKYLSRGKQILRGFLYHSAALFFGRYLLKYLRVLRLGNAQIEIPAELLAYAVIMGMQDSCFRRIHNFIPRFHCLCRKEHVLVKNRFCTKPPNFS